MYKTHDFHHFFLLDYPDTLIVAIVHNVEAAKYKSKEDN